jgi:hypothetical protein
MTETYDIHELIGVSENKHFAEYVAHEVERAMNDLGHNVDLIGLLTPESGTVPFKANVKLTPDVSETVLEAFESGFGWLSVNDDLADHFGRSRGSSNVTSIAVDEGLTAYEVIQALQNATYDGDVGQIDKGIHLLELMSRETDENPEVLMAYQLFQKALGWYSERILDETDEFNKGNTAQDKGGIDGWFKGEAVQLKTVTRYASKGKSHFEAKEMEHIFYQWTKDGKIVVGKDANAVHREATIDKPEEMTATNYKKSYNGGMMDNYHRTARVIWY